MNFTNFTNFTNILRDDDNKSTQAGNILLGVYLFIWMCVCLIYIIQRCCFKYRDNVRDDHECKQPLL